MNSDTKPVFYGLWMDGISMIKLLSRCIYLILFLVPCFLFASFKNVHWGTDEWLEVTNSDGTGLYHELIGEIFTSEGYKLEVSYFPWQRVLQNLNDKKIDMTGGLPERDQYYQSNQPVLSQRIVLVIAKDKVDSFDIDKIQNYRGSWRKGYKQDIVHHVLTPPVIGTYVNQAKHALSFIEADKVDYYVDIEDVINRELKPDDDKFKVLQIGYFNLYWSFTQSEKGLELKHHFDQKWSQLMKNGFISTLYKRYDASMPQQNKLD